MRTLTSRLALPVCGALLWFSHAAQAAVVFDQGDVTGESDFINNGNILLANNLGSGATAQTVNGISFGTSTAGLSGMFNGGGDFNTQFPVGSPLDQVLSGLVYQGGGFSSLTLSGLSSGTDYFLQLFLSNAANNTGKASRVTVQGQQYNISNFGSTADYINIDFTASGSSEVISFGTGSGSEAARMILNAYALSGPSAQDIAVPLPIPLTLFAPGLIALGLLGLTRLSRNPAPITTNHH